ncbi:hypothetical protein FBU30_006548 [Linnemannia zychae]|nr:hypothetical protein FBU30_006548 [Linnemannia zychae]
MFHNVLGKSLMAKDLDIAQSANTPLQIDSVHRYIQYMEFAWSLKISGQEDVHEYYSSARCLRSACEKFLKSGRNRSRYRQACKVYIDRGIAGAESIRHVVLSQLAPQQRHQKYRAPQDQDEFRLPLKNMQVPTLFKLQW